MNHFNTKYITAYFQDKISETSPIILGCLFSAVFLLIPLLANCFTFIPAGHKGVLYKPLNSGVQVNYMMGEGCHLKCPWDSVTQYCSRFRYINKDYEDILTKNGLAVNVHMAILYTLSPEKIAFLHKEVGPDYIYSIIAPIVGSSVREAIGQQDPTALYHEERTELEEAINRLVQEKLRKMQLAHFFANIVINIQGVDLPTKLDKAIQQKLEEEQKSLQYEYKKDIAKMAADIKITIAKGENSANKIIAENITDKLIAYLQASANVERQKALIKAMENENENKQVVYFLDSSMPTFVQNMPNTGRGEINKDPHSSKL